MAREATGSAKFVHEVYTVVGGEQKYNRDLFTKGGLIGSAATLAIVGGTALVTRIVRKVRKSKKGE